MQDVILRLAGEVSFLGKMYSPSLVFWRKLEEQDPKHSVYKWRICRCLVEIGIKQKKNETLEEAVEAGQKAVKVSRSRNPDALASLAMAYHATGKLQDALKFMRKATYLGGPSYDEYKALEKAYSREILELHK